MDEEECNVTEGISPRSRAGMIQNPGAKRPSGFRLEDRGMNGTGAGRGTGALLRDGGKTLLIAAKLPHPAHHAMMLAVPAAAGGKIRVGAGAKGGHDQRQAEDHCQRKCDRAAH